MYARESVRERGRHPKGQMFLIASLLIMTGMAVLFSVVSPKTATEEKKFQDTSLIDKAAANMVAEYKYLIGIATSAGSNKSASDFAANFSSYLRDDAGARALYAIAFVNGSNQHYSVNIGNYLGGTINITLNATGSAPQGYSVVIADRANKTFYFAAAANGTVAITMNYTEGSRRIVEEFGVSISAKNFMKGLFDITLSDGQSSINIKDTYNRTW